ncbi:MAG: DUF6457 domain-containing protein [Solirubrobacterales bacterium]|nr:hypothetical protein [Solirubrobacterales bacterium]
MAETSGIDWIEAFAEAADAEAPDEEQIARLLKLASVAAHSSERIAAPIACWIAGSAGIEAERAIEIAESLAGDA